MQLLKFFVKGYMGNYKILIKISEIDQLFLRWTKIKVWTIHQEWSVFSRSDVKLEGYMNRVLEKIGEGKKEKIYVRAKC